MDLQAANLLNGKSWGWAKLAAFAFFAIAGALLIASLSATNGPFAKQAVSNDHHLQLSAYSPAAVPANTTRR